MRRVITAIFLTACFFAGLPKDVRAAFLSGDALQFSVDASFDAHGRSSVAATLRATGEAAYFFVEDSYYDARAAEDQDALLDNIASLAQEFDAVIYPRLTAFLGREWRPGIDNENRIFILFTDIHPEAGGYVNTGDELPRSILAVSNEKELIYVNVRHAGSARAKGFLAHELQHLISFNQKERLQAQEEEVWLNEVRSEYAVTFLGYDESFSGSNLENRATVFHSNPSASLTSFEGTAAHYGAVNLYGQFIAGVLGDEFFSRTMQRVNVGIASIEETFADLRDSRSFAETVLDWHIANWVNDPEIAQGRYAYANPALRSFTLDIPTIEFLVGEENEVSAARTVEDWAGSWWRFAASSSRARTAAFTVAPRGVEDDAMLHAAAVLELMGGGRDIRYFDFSTEGVGATLTLDLFGSDVRAVTVVLVSGMRTQDFSETADTIAVEVSVRTVSSEILQVSALSLARSFVSGGEEVTVSGFGFDRTTAIFFGEVLAEAAFIDSAALRVVVPAHGAGPACIIAQRESGERSLPLCGAFTYIEPRVSGTLLRSPGTSRVWVTKGEWRRHIPAAEVFEFYPHLRWGDIVEVPRDELELYKESPWVRSADDFRVFELNGDLSKHWLNMTAGEFAGSGRLWDGVFIINDRERDFYVTGVDVLFRE